jgi:hypothetical protein
MSDQPIPYPPHDPQPLAGHADSLAPPPSSSNLDADITDELTDHLALSARDLQLTGHAPTEAHQIAQQKFGDIATIRRRLFWIHQGDEVMLRTALAVICAVLIVAVAALGIGNWRMSRTIDDLHGTLADVSENQKRITDAQKIILEAQQLNRPLSIQGLLYLGDPSKPAAGADVHLYRVSDRKLIDEYTTTPEGRFTTAPQAPDRYFLVAPLVGANPNVRRLESSTSGGFSSSASSGARSDSGPAFAVQTPPITLSQQNYSPAVELDVRMIPVGQVSFDMSAPMPSFRFPGPARQRDRHQALESQLRERRISLPSTLRSRLQIVLLKEGPPLPVLATRQRELADWPLTRGLYHGDLGETYDWLSSRWSEEVREQTRRTSEKLAKMENARLTPSLDLLLYRRFEGSIPRF